MSSLVVTPVLLPSPILFPGNCTIKQMSSIQKSASHVMYMRSHHLGVLHLLDRRVVCWALSLCLFGSILGLCPLEASNWTVTENSWSKSCFFFFFIFCFPQLACPCNQPQVVAAGELEIQGHPCLHRAWKATQGCTMKHEVCLRSLHCLLDSISPQSCLCMDSLSVISVLKIWGSVSSFY